MRVVHFGFGDLPSPNKSGMGMLFSQPDVDDYENYVETDPDYIAAPCSGKPLFPINTVTKSLFIENLEHCSNMTLDAIHTENKLASLQNPQLTREGINRIKFFLDTQDKVI